MNSQQYDSKVNAINRAIKECRSIGSGRIKVVDGVLLLDDRFVAKMSDDGLLIGVPNGMLKAEAMDLLKMLEGVFLQVSIEVSGKGNAKGITSKKLYLNGLAWTGEPTFVDTANLSWKYKVD